ncbi:MAG: PIN domain-containing protein [Gaiella sp.]
MTLYLADTSIWSWAHGERRPDISDRLAAIGERDELATCVPVVLEAQHRARTGDEYESVFEASFGTLRWLRTGETELSRALDVQRSLAHAGHGYHRRPSLDYLIAATAELAGPDVVLWAFDRDMGVICEHTGQPCELETADPVA